MDELERQNGRSIPLYIRKGRGVTGTYGVKEIVYAYAMWISPEYQLKVIRAYDGLVENGVAVHENNAQDLLDNPLKYFELLMVQAKQIQAEKLVLEEEAKKNAPKVDDT